VADALVEFPAPGNRTLFASNLALQKEQTTSGVAGVVAPLLYLCAWNPARTAR